MISLSQLEEFGGVEEEVQGVSKPCLTPTGIYFIVYYTEDLIQKYTDYSETHTINISTYTHKTGTWFIITLTFIVGH